MPMRQRSVVLASDPAEARQPQPPQQPLIFGFEKNQILAVSGAAAITSVILGTQYYVYVNFLAPAAAAADGDLPYLTGYA